MAMSSFHTVWGTCGKIERGISVLRESTMSYHSYCRAAALANERENRKLPGQKFCDEVGWRLTSKYRELQRPDKVTWVGGTQYRTITPTCHVWYQNNSNGEHVWIEFSGMGGVTVKRGIRVTQSEGTSFGQVSLYPDADCWRERIVFDSNRAACDYLLRI